MAKNLFPYQRVRQFLLEQLTKGVWKPGENLPSEVALAKQLKVHRLTVNRVLGELVRDGIVERRRGVGTKVLELKSPGPSSPFGKGLVGLVTGHHFNPVTNTFYSEIFESLRKALQALGIYLMPLGDAEEFLEMLHTGAGRSMRNSLSALVVLGPVEQKSLALIEAAGHPIVLLGFSEYPGPLPSVATDDYEDASRLGAIVTQLGHEKIVHINARPPMRLMSRLEGFLAGCEAHGHPLPYRYVLEASGLEVADGRVAMLDFLERGLPFTAVFGGIDNLALGAMIALQEKGLRVPEDVSVVGFDGIPLPISRKQTLATMQVPRARLGREASEVLAALCNGQIPSQKTLLPSTWINGDTLAAPCGMPTEAVSCCAA